MRIVCTDRALEFLQTCAHSEQEAIKAVLRDVRSECSGSSGATFDCLFFELIAKEYFIAYRRDPSKIAVMEIGKFGDLPSNVRRRIAASLDSLQDTESMTTRARADLKSTAGSYRGPFLARLPSGEFAMLNPPSDVVQEGYESIGSTSGQISDHPKIPQLMHQRRIAELTLSKMKGLPLTKANPFDWHSTKLARPASMSECILPLMAPVDLAELQVELEKRFMELSKLVHKTGAVLNLKVHIK